MKTHGRLLWLDGTEAAPDADPPRIATPAYWGVRTAPYVTIKVKRLFPRANPYRDGTIALADTTEVARDLEWLMERYPLEADEALRARLHERAEEHRRTEREVHAILTGERAHFVFREPARPARDYQLTAADLVLETGQLLLADVVGLGKTMSALLILREERALPALVVCPTHLPKQWVEELAISLPWLKAHIVRKMAPYDPASHREMKGHTPDVLVVPYSKLRTWGDFLAGQVNTVIFDEVQDLRKRGSAKWMAAATVADKAAYRVGLTATPVYNYAGEIHSIYEVLAPGALGTREEFVREWGGAAVRQSMDGDNVSVRDPAALGLYLRSEGLMLRRTRKDVGRELPTEPMLIPVTIDTDEDLLERLSGDVIDLADLIVQKTSPGIQMMQMRGELDWRLRRATGVAKAAYVADFVDGIVETEEQVVLFGWHRDVYTIWERKLAGHHPVFYTGTESPAQKQRARDAFLDGEARVLCMSLRSGSGLDGLQKASHIAVFGELDWSPGIHVQCVGRLDRDGQEEPVLAYFLVSEGGSDPVVAEVLNIKRMQSEPLIDPDAPLLAPIADPGDRVLKLAEYVLRKRRRNKP